MTRCPICETVMPPGWQSCINRNCAGSQAGNPAFGWGFYGPAKPKKTGAKVEAPK